MGQSGPKLPMGPVAAMLQAGEQEIEATVSGSSMGHAIPDGATVRILCRHDAYRIGTPVAVLNGRNLVVHRVVYRGHRRRTQNFLVTQGDSAVLCDPPVSDQAILGEVLEWRTGPAWHPVGAGSHSNMLARWWAAFHRRLISAVMEIHVHLAVLLARALKRVALALARRRARWTGTRLST